LIILIKENFLIQERKAKNQPSFLTFPFFNPEGFDNHHKKQAQPSQLQQLRYL